MVNVNVSCSKGIKSKLKIFNRNVDGEGLENNMYTHLYQLDRAVTLFNINNCGKINSIDIM